jgi:formate/nitrite transporter
MSNVRLYYEREYTMSEIFGFDAFSPKEIAAQVETIGVAKARLPLLSMLMLSVLAGAFIGLGALYFVLVKSDPSLGFAASQVLGGVAFSLGLILVVVAGAELFTGNNLLAMAWADGKISTLDLLRNWAIVCVGNFIGAAGLALLVFLSRHPEMNNGAIAQEYLAIAVAKIAMPFWTAFFKGILCNVLVCMAVWMALAGRSVIDKAVAIVFPISAFVAAGFEHSVANMYFIPLAMLLQTFENNGVTANTVTWVGFFSNLVPVILGNIIGGSVLVGLVYHVIYRRAPGRRSNV